MRVDWEYWNNMTYKHTYKRTMTYNTSQFQEALNKFFVIHLNFWKYGIFYESFENLLKFLLVKNHHQNSTFLDIKGAERMIKTRYLL